MELGAQTRNEYIAGKQVAAQASWRKEYSSTVQQDLWWLQMNAGDWMSLTKWGKVYDHKWLMNYLCASFLDKMG